MVRPLLYGSLPGGVHNVAQNISETKDTKIEYGAECTEQERHTFWISDHRPVFSALSLSLPNEQTSPNSQSMKWQHSLSLQSSPVRVLRIEDRLAIG